MPLVTKDLTAMLVCDVCNRTRIVASGHNALLMTDEKARDIAAQIGWRMDVLLVACDEHLTEETVCQT